MPRHFSSVLRIVSKQDHEQNSDISTLTIRGDGKSVELPKQHAEKPFTFDRVYFAADDNTTVYKGSVKEIVEGSLLGYHGTIISTGESGLKFSDTFASGAKRSPGLILKAADHIFVCIKRSRSRTGSSLVVLCSYLAVIKEKVYDLLRNYGNEAPNSGDFPVVSCKQGQLLGRAAFQAKNPATIRKFLSHGEEVLTKIKQELFAGQDNSQWHTIFMITVEHAQFGAQFAPVSGTLSLVQLSSSTTDNDNNSYGSFVAVIDQLASTKLDLKSVNKQPEYSKSVLTEILKESLGGNCRTVLISHVNFSLHFPDRALQVLETGSKACSVHNQPNKRDLAEQALMSAYMKELRQIYGDVVMAVEEKSSGNSFLHPPTPPVPNDGSTTKLNAASKTSVLTTDIDDTYDELIKDLQPASGGSSGVMTAPKRFVEMAANALAEAALEGDSEDSEAEDTEEDVSNANLITTNDEPCSSKAMIGASKKGKGAAKGPGSGDSRSASSHDDGDIPENEKLMMSLAADGFSGGHTSIYEALAAILQDPDRGAHRVQDRKDIKIRKDVGALFSGADIVQWMLESLAGLETSEEAEKLGQLLLDQGAILHSEGSSIFANAKSLFYYVHRPRAAGKMLSREEVGTLLAQASGDNNQTSITVVEHPSTSPVTILHEEEGNTATSVVEKMGDSQSSTEEITLPDNKAVPLPVEDIGSSTALKVSSHLDDDKLSDVVVLPVEPGDHEQEVDHLGQGVAVTGDSDQQQEVNEIVTDQLEPTEQQEASKEQEASEQQEVDHMTEQQDRMKSTTSLLPLGSSSSVSSKMRKRKSITSKSSKTKMKTQLSMLEELNRQLQGAETSSSSLAVNTGGADFWSRGQVQPEDGSGWSHGPSKSSGLHQTLGLQEYDEDDDNEEEKEEEPLPELIPCNKLSYSEVPNVTTTTGIEELQEIDDIEAYPTPLHMSAALGKKEGVISNLSMMYGVNNEDVNGRTPLMYATIKNKVRSCHALIKCGAKIDQADHMGTTALHYAAFLGYCSVISLLLSKGATPLLRDCQGQTALHLATVLATTAAIQVILKSSTEVIKEEDNHRLTPIHWAVAFDHVEQMKILIKGIPDPGGLDSCGRSLLNYSICCNAIKCMNALISLHPLLMDVTDSNGHLPIHVACMQESATPLNILLQADVIDPEKQKQPLHLNATDAKGKTALHWSVTYNQCDITEVLLKHGALTDIADEEGQTPLDICRQNDDDGMEILRLLQKGIHDAVHAEDDSLQRRQKSRSKFCLLL